MVAAGKTYVRELTGFEWFVPSTPDNPRGVAGSAGQFRDAKREAFFLAGMSAWLDRRLNVLYGVRHDTWDDVQYYATAPMVTPSKGDSTSYNLGANYQLRRGLHAYYGYSVSYKTNLTNLAPDGSANPLISTGKGHEVGLKFDLFEDRVSGSLAYFKIKSVAENFLLAGTYATTVNPAGINGRVDPNSNWIGVDRDSNGLELMLTAQPIKGWRSRLNTAVTDGVIGETKAFNILYNDQFFTDSRGGVIFGTGDPLLVKEQRPTDDVLYRTAYRDRLAEMPLVPGYVANAEVQTPKLPLNIYSGKQIASYDYRLTPASLREQQVRICQTVTGVDRLLGRLRAQLRTLGLADNTIIVYSSDNGILHGEWGYGGKCLLYEPAIHVPLIIHDPRPGAPRGRRIRDALAVSPDVAPTILDLCGLTPPARMQGRSLVPVMRGSAVDWREDFFCESHILFQNYPITQGVRSQRWKYIRYWPLRPVPKDYREILNLGHMGDPPPYEELFDLQNDPREQTNLAAAADQRETLARLRARCVVLQREALGRDPGAPLPSESMKEWTQANETFTQALQKNPSM